jgi:hypothetical protein
VDEEKEKVLSQYGERVAKIETQMAVVLVEQSNLRTIVDKQNALLEALVKQSNVSEFQTKAILERTEKHTVEMEKQAAQMVDMGKILASFGVQLNIIKVVGTGLLTLVLAYLFSHFIH